MSVAYVGTFSTAGLAALDRASAAYQQNVASGDWNKMKKVEGKKDAVIHPDSLKNKTVNIDGIKMTYRQAYATKQLRENAAGKTIYGVKGRDGMYRMQTMNSGNQAMAVRASSAQAHVPATRISRGQANNLRNMKMSNKSAKQLRNQQTTAQKAAARANRNTPAGQARQNVTANVRRQINDYRDRANSSLGLKSSSSNRSTRAGQNKKASTRKNRNTTRKRYSSRRRR